MAELGNVRRFYLKPTGSYEWLAGEQSNSFNRSAETVEVSDKSTTWAQFISGKKSATADVTVNLDDDASEPQHKALEALHKGTEVDCFIGKLDGGDSGEPSEGDAFKAIVTAVNDTNDNFAVASRSISLQVNGEPTHYPTIGG